MRAVSHLGTSFPCGQCQLISILTRKPHGGWAASNGHSDTPIGRRARPKERKLLASPRLHDTVNKGFKQGGFCGKF